DHILSVEVNLAYYLQALVRRRSSRKEEILVDVYDNRRSPLVGRIVIAAMANWGLSTLIATRSPCGWSAGPRTVPS
ncbi:MAG: hypothetical protein IIA63_04840, partial [Nitrospinae bacterium]|nr:hypothetical protein [Nitrospinota bacterium]